MCYPWMTSFPHCPPVLPSCLLCINTFSCSFTICVSICSPALRPFVYQYAVLYWPFVCPFKEIFLFTLLLRVHLINLTIFHSTYHVLFWVNLHSFLYRNLPLFVCPYHQFPLWPLLTSAIVYSVLCSLH